MPSATFGTTSATGERRSLMQGRLPMTAVSVVRSWVTGSCWRRAAAAGGAGRGGLGPAGWASHGQVRSRGGHSRVDIENLGGASQFEDAVDTATGRGSHPEGCPCGGCPAVSTEQRPDPGAVAEGGPGGIGDDHGGPAFQGPDEGVADLAGVHKVDLARQGDRDCLPRARNGLYWSGGWLVRAVSPARA